MAGNEETSRILIIDDDEEMLQTLHTLLSIDGFDVTVSSNPIDGMALAEKIAPAVIILDVMMPEMDGIEVMNRLRERDSTAEIPIIFLSAAGDEQTKIAGLRGGDDYILKPFRTLELEARIRKVLERRAGANAAHGGPALSLERLAVNVGEETYLVPIEQVYYFEASGKYAYAHTRDKKYLTHFSIGELENKLKDNDIFMRIHRSFIINTRVVQRVTRDERKNTAVIADQEGSVLRISGPYLAPLKEKLGL